MIDPSILLDPPRRNEHPANILWVDEQIWGHRLWDSQSSWLVFLELLNLAEACLQEECLLDERGVFYPLHYRPYKRMHLCNILFNNERLTEIALRAPIVKRPGRRGWTGCWTMPRECKAIFRILKIVFIHSMNLYRSLEC